MAIHSIPTPEAPTSEAGKLQERLSRVEISEDLICDNRHEKETIGATIRCVESCVKRACGLNPMCSHTVDLRSFYQEAEEPLYKENSGKTLDDVVYYLLRKGYLEEDTQKRLEMLKNLKSSLDTLVQYAIRGDTIRVVNDLPEDINEAYQKVRASYHPDNPEEYKVFMEIKAWLYKEMKQLVDLLKEKLSLSIQESEE